MEPAPELHRLDNLLVGTAHICWPVLEPGDEFEIKLDRHQINLMPPGVAEGG